MTPSLPHIIPTVKDVGEIELKGSWRTKSGGELNVLFGIPYEDLQANFLEYDSERLASISKDIRGLRSYKVSNIPKGTIGANEWHTLRQELIFAIQGNVQWTCEDIYGKKKILTLNEAKGIWIRPYILHTYKALSDNANLLVVANTLFFPDDPSTHDTYTIEQFRELQHVSKATPKVVGQR